MAAPRRRHRAQGYRDPAAATAVAGDAGYGWLGAKQRSTTPETAGLTLMGDRLYNAARGLFTSLDPEPGGNANPYTYPTDPINQSDLDGHFGWRKFWRRAAKIAGFVAVGACILASAGLCAVASAFAVGASVGWNSYQKRWGTRTERRRSGWYYARQVGIDSIGLRFKGLRAGVRYARHARAARRILSSWRRGRHASRLYEHSYRHVARHHPVRFATRLGLQSFYAYRAHTTSW